MGRESRANLARRQAATATHHLARPAQTVRHTPVGTGLTTSERYLSSLCKRTFLSLWANSNVFRDKGTELCDLLVVFENHILIFSDKECAFGDSGDIDRDWSRWYRKAIKWSADQLWGAERWIKQHPDRMFLDPRCTESFPVSLPNIDAATIHLIVVAHGAAERCKAYFRGGSGSLMIMPSISGDDHYLPRSKGGMPFSVGSVDPSKRFVHVLDDTSLDILLTTLDTVSDFVQYLEKKTAFIASGRLATAAGEEELLGFYLSNLNAADEHDFIVDTKSHSISLDEGFWDDFKKSPHRQRQIAADKVSYTWDGLVEHFNGHFARGSMEYMSQANLDNHEKLMRWFAREPRTRRRMLAKTLYEIVEITPPGMRFIRVHEPSRPGDPHYVFVLVPWMNDRSYEENRQVRRDYLQMCCLVAKVAYPLATDIVGFATETKRGEEGSEDALYMNARTWTSEDKENARELQTKFQILTAATRHVGFEKEYPD